MARRYDKLYEEYTGDAMQMFEVNEEMCSTDGNYNINSDTMTVTLHNTDRKFDKGYLRSLMILGRTRQYVCIGTDYRSIKIINGGNA